MSFIDATVSDIQISESLHIVSFDFHGEILSMMSLELEDALKIGSQVKLQVKPSHVAISKDLNQQLSYSNQIPSTISNIDSGKLVTTLSLNTNESTIESLITSKSAKRMGLQKGDKVVALIKASELSIAEILHA